MKKTKSNCEKRILEIIKSMEGNTFLLPDAWSEKMVMTTKQESYRTYVGTRGEDRYINVEYWFENDEFIAIEFRNEKVLINDHSPFKPVPKLKEKILYVMEAIYKEKHSFIESAKGVKKIRKSKN